MNILRGVPIAIISGLLGAHLFAAEITVSVDKPGAAISPTFYGAFFEDINRAGDGGLYAEMLQNRSFEDAAIPLGWMLLKTGNAEGAMSLDKTQPLNAKNPTCLKLEITNAGNGRVGIVNQGFKGAPMDEKIPNADAQKKWFPKFAAAAEKSKQGLNVVQGKEYVLTLYAKSSAIATLTVALEKQDGTSLAEQEIKGIDAGWKKLEVRFTAKGSDTNARLTISANKPGTLFLDMVSLFPKDTWKGRPNGLRPDMAQMLADMHPGLLRFPGGSFSEAHQLADAWRWKDTIGDVAERPGNWNIWGYRSSNGLGFHEYLQMAEDLGAEPLFVAHVGMSEKDFAPMDKLEPWIQDVLDAIEYANGAETSKWGALRAKNGHPKPFNLKYVEIGNENGMGYSWGGGTRQDYLPRYQAFYERIKAAYPSIVTIANIHTEPDVSAEVVDEHYYENADWFFKAAVDRLDKYDRKKPKIYMGEYAVKNDGGNGNMRGALGEAAFLTALERNADVVTMTSYAPFFTNPEWQRWQPNAVTFDNARVYGAPSYHVQALFGSNRPDVTLPTKLSSSALPVPTFFAVAGLKKDKGDLILKVVNSSDKAESATVQLEGLQGKLGKGICTTLSAHSLTDENTFDQPKKVAPKTSDLPAYAVGCTHEFPPYSVTILRWTRN